MVFHTRTCLDDLIDWLMDWWMDGWIDWWIDGWMDGLIDWLIDSHRIHEWYIYLHEWLIFLFFLINVGKSNRPMDPSWDWLIDPILPQNLTWNLKMMVWKMIFLFNWVIFRFHVKFQGCNPPSKDFLSLQFLSCHWRSRWISWSQCCGHTRRDDKQMTHGVVDMTKMHPRYVCWAGCPWKLVTG